MPTYRYKCKACINELTKKQLATDKPLLVCPKCGCWMWRTIIPDVKRKKIRRKKK